MILLLLFSFFLLGIHSDPISVEVLIRCDPSISFWAGELTIYEDDILSNSDLLKYRNFTSHELTKHMMFEPFFPLSDPGLNYEIAYELKHNCTHTGKTLCIQSSAVAVDRFGRQNVDFYIRAFDNGVEDCPVIELEPARFI